MRSHALLQHQTSHGPARFAFTGRAGGVSTGPYGTLNLGGHVGDDPQAVTSNRGLVAASIGRPSGGVLYMNQVHGADVVTADAPWGTSVPAADAMITRRADLALAVLVADCVPVVLADPAAGVLGVAHAGRPGLAAGVVPAVVEAMRQAGAADIVAVVGPSVCGGCYEVPEAMRAEVAALVPEAHAVTTWGTPALDLGAGALAQLRRSGVDASRIQSCTREDAELFSYRREQVTGRFAGLAWLPAT